MGGKVVISQETKKLKLIYPCQWSYKVIIQTDIDIKDILLSVLSEREHTVKKANFSKNGKYQSHNVSLLVHNDDDRYEIFSQFKEDKNVKMVL